tara:strand:- start:152624 stop:153313 length:690 start_codon:yes stop_codon:yes gene_type:complete
MPVRVLIGLGNPGRSYDKTRHNIGFLILDALAAKAGAEWKEKPKFSAHTTSIVLAGQEILLVKPLTFMNESGRSVGAICRFYRWNPSEVCVVYDEYQLSVSDSKLSVGGGAGGHNGVHSLIAHGFGDVVRYRIGVGPEVKPSVPLADFVLGRFSSEESELIEKAIPAIIDGLELLCRLDVAKAMNTLNQRLKTKKKSNDSDSDAQLPHHGDSQHTGLPRPSGESREQSE